MKRCSKCGKERGLVTIYHGKDKYSYMCGECWRKDRENEGTTYDDL